MSPCQCHKQERFHEDWASLLTAEEKAQIESGAFVSSVPLVGADPKMVRRVMGFVHQLSEPESQEHLDKAGAERQAVCARCVCRGCQARDHGACEKNCELCGRIRELSRCDFKDRWRYVPERRR